MQVLKKFLWTLATGGLIGALGFAWLSPDIIVWYFSPPADLGISCKPAVSWALETYRKVTFTGVVLGAIVASILFFAFGRRGASAQSVPPDARNF